MNEIKSNKNLLANFAFFVISIFGIYSAQGVIVPFLLAIFATIICFPLVGLFTRFRVPHGGAVMLAVVIVLLIGSSVGQFIGSSLKGFSGNMPAYKEQLRDHIQNIPYLSEVTILDQPLSETLMQVNPEKAMGIGANILSNLGDVLSNTLLILLVAIFILMEIGVFKDKIIHFSCSKVDYSEKINSFILSVKNYMMIKTWISLVTGLLISFCLWIIGVEHFMLWGFIAFIFNYVPTVGSLLAAIPAVCLAFIQFGSGTALLVIIVFVAVNLIMGNVVEPKFMGEGLGLSPTFVLMSLIFWGSILGPIGMLLSIPLTMVVKIAANNSDDWHWLSIILSDKVDEEKPTSIITPDSK